MYMRRSQLLKKSDPLFSKSLESHLTRCSFTENVAAYIYVQNHWHDMELWLVLMLAPAAQAVRSQGKQPKESSVIFVMLLK